MKQSEARFMVPLAGVEPAISWMRTRYPRPLDDSGISAKTTKPRQQNDIKNVLIRQARILALEYKKVDFL